VFFFWLFRDLFVDLLNENLTTLPRASSRAISLVIGHSGGLIARICSHIRTLLGMVLG